MKKNLFPYFFNFVFLVIITSLLPNKSFAQNKIKKDWTITNPFKTDVFIENFGQFNNWVKSPEIIKYVINSSEKIFFTPNGYSIRLDKIEQKEESDDDKDIIKGSAAKNNEEEEENRILEKYTVHMKWLGSNPDPEIIANEPTSNYYTFGEEGYENIKAKGYKILVYKNLYPNIDVEYTIPEKGGMKYKLILHPGADISQVQMKYSGDVENSIIDSEGNIIISTPSGEIIDHAPLSYFEGNEANVSSAFVLKDNVVSFHINELQTSNSILQTLIIDPWTVVPTALTNDNAAYDLAVDNYGNVYVAGGTITPYYLLAKYSTSGNLIWTFTIPSNWSPNYYSKFCILPQTGTVFIGEALNISGPRVMKISPSGTLVTISPNMVPNNEIWVMFYNRCLGKLIAFGGGFSMTENIYTISDTNLTNGTTSNFNTCTGPNNDIASAIMDYNGDFYCLTTSSSSFCSINNHLMKSLVSLNYNPPLAFDVNTGYDFYECLNNGIPGFAGYATVRANALALNINYLFSYDGDSLKAWDKTNGNLLSSIGVDASYAGGKNRTHEGIAVDDCNNIYVGGSNIVHEYSFDGSTFTSVTTYTAYIPGEVYDIYLDKSFDNLYVCGLGFVSTFPVTFCPVNQLSISFSVDSCTNAATVSVIGGTPPYSYLWSNGATTGTISGVNPGVYTVTVVDNSCVIKTGIDSVNINSPYNMYVSNDTTICLGTSVVLSAHGANSYLWSPATGLSSVTDSVVTATPNDTTIYIVTGTFPNGCSVSFPVAVNIIGNPTIIVSNDTTICNGDSIGLYAFGGNSYEWSPTNSLSNYQVSNPYAHPSVTTTYTVTGTIAPCSASNSVTVSIMDINDHVCSDTTICLGEQAFLHAAGGTNYFWIPSDGLNSQSIPSPIAAPNSTTMYFVTISDGGCKKVDSVNVSVFDCLLVIPNVFTPNGDGTNDFFNINYLGYENYNLLVFNRWGVRLFESNDKNILWNGKAPDGRYASDGEYFYILNIGEKSYHGIVTLLR